ncbi:MAG: type I DNA topoisomerase, partial [Pseudomonadota bacterium]|nr:type I DNA topoisomerase [Pseudomonadota bacterium]
DKVLRELKKAAAGTEHIYLATDLDREGEAIAWHLREAIGGAKDRYKRVTFSEITQRAIAESFKDPQQINMNRVNAQQARRFLDRVVGYMVSPLLWKKIARGISAGRVQSVAVKLVAQREHEISAFKVEEFWVLFAHYGEGIKAQVSKENGKTFRPPNAEVCREKMQRLQQYKHIVSACEQKTTQVRAPAPLETSSLQQAASTRLGFGVKKTMTIAQRLYEAGHITYMRTDSTSISKEALSACRAFIKKTYDAPYLPAQPNIYASSKQAQEAHEAIRPTNMLTTPQKFQDSDASVRRLYELIWQYFVASQMTPAQFDLTNITVTAGEFELKLRGRVLRFAGYQEVLKPMSANKDDEQIIVQELPEGKVLDLKKLEDVQKFTKPPPRYSESSLVRELKKVGIGRPSTYATTISTIQDRGYVKSEQRRFYLQKIGDIVTKRLDEHFKKLMDVGFTAEMEEQLDAIANGKVKWLEVLDEFYDDFRRTLHAAEEGMQPSLPTMIDLDCGKCQRKMMVRNASTGVFLGCSGYQLSPQERCKETINLIPDDEIIVAGDGNDDGEAKELRKRHRCSACDAAMTSYLIDKNKRLHLCSNHPDCEGFEVEHGEFKLKGYDGIVLECEKCGSEMHLRSGRFGKFFACTAYPTCQNTRKVLRNGEPAPPRADPVPMPDLKCEKSDGHFVLRDGAAGIFLASSNYPKSRETRAPLIEELLRYADQLDPKFSFFLDAPPTDDKGNKTVVRFSRKTKSYYLAAIDRQRPGKQRSGWSAVWENGRWRTINAKQT